MNIRTKRGARRRYDAIIRQCYRDLAGGTQYGIDMPTLRITFPDRWNEIQALRDRWNNLPD